MQQSPAPQPKGHNVRIHSDTLTAQDLQDAVYTVSSDAPHIYLAQPPSVHGSRSHARAYGVALRGSGARHRRRPMGSPDDSGYAATYEDHGYWLAELFRRDYEMKVGSVYKNEHDFREKTGWKFS